MPLPRGHRGHGGDGGTGRRVPAAPLPYTPRGRGAGLRAHEMHARSRDLTAAVERRQLAWACSGGTGPAASSVNTTSSQAVTQFSGTHSNPARQGNRARHGTSHVADASATSPPAETWQILFQCQITGRGRLHHVRARGRQPVLPARLRPLRKSQPHRHL
jgi:hypothetical protein